LDNAGQLNVGFSLGGGRGGGLKAGILYPSTPPDHQIRIRFCHEAIQRVHCLLQEIVKCITIYITHTLHIK
jgi:hypothetical protein